MKFREHLKSAFGKVGDFDIEKRNTLKVVAGGILFTSLPIFAQKLLAQEKISTDKKFVESKDLPHLEKVLDTQINEIKRIYGITVNFENSKVPHGKTFDSGNKVSVDELNDILLKIEAALEIAIALRRYPPKNLRKFVDHIVVGTKINLFKKGYVKDVRGDFIGLAPKDKKIIWLRTDKITGRQEKVFRSYLIDHEIFHHVVNEEIIPTTVWEDAIRTIYADPYVNPKGLSIPKYTYPEDVTNVRFPGFSRPYGLFSKLEDISTLGEMAMGHIGMTRELKEDFILGTKVRMVKMLFSQALGLPEDYWSVLLKDDGSDNYWPKYWAKNGLN